MRLPENTGHLRSGGWAPQKPAVSTHRGALVLEAVPTWWPSERRAHGGGRGPGILSRRSRDQGLALRRPRTCCAPVRRKGGRTPSAKSDEPHDPLGGASPAGLHSVEEPRTVHQTVVGNFTTAFRIKPHGRLAAGPTRAAPPTPAPPQFLGKGPTLKGSEIEPRGAPWWRGGLGICGYHCCARVTAGAQVRPPGPRAGPENKPTNQRSRATSRAPGTRGLHGRQPPSPSHQSRSPREVQVAGRTRDMPPIRTRKPGAG